ncbi:hypothetical protein [Tenacibaculum phage Larrie]|nr:hypothetical protein [Tenacibaculum phage Larrie]
MVISEVISKLERIKKNYGDIECRKGTYNGQDECIEDVYRNEG